MIVACAFGLEQAVNDAPRLHATGVDVQLQQVTLRPCQQIALLLLEHLQVFGENLALALTNELGQCRFFGAEAAGHPPEVPDRGFCLWGDEVDHGAADLVLGGGVMPTFTGMSHTDIDKDVARWREAADLPAIDRHVAGKAIALQR